VRINKTERNDAVGLAELLVSGWYKQVTVKSLESHRIRTVLTNRALQVGIRQDLENQVRLGAQDVRLCARQGARDVCRSRQ
jgi:transposase